MMDLTPLEVRKKKGDFRRQIRGYDPESVDDFLDLVADRLEQLVRENAAMTESSGGLEQRVSEYREREKALTEALVSAQQLREEMRAKAAKDADAARSQAAKDADEHRSQAAQEAEQSRREAREILDRARAEAAELVAAAHREAEDERAQAVAELHRTRAFETEIIERLQARRTELLESFRSLLEREVADLESIEAVVRGDIVELPAPPVAPVAPAVAADALAGLPMEAPAAEAVPVPAWAQDAEDGLPALSPDLAALIEAAESDVDLAWTEEAPEPEVELAADVAEADEAFETTAGAEVSAVHGTVPGEAAEPLADEDLVLLDAETETADNDAAQEAAVDAWLAEIVEEADDGQPATARRPAWESVPASPESDEDFIDSLIAEAGVMPTVVGEPAVDLPDFLSDDAATDDLILEAGLAAAADAVEVEDLEAAPDNDVPAAEQVGDGGAIVAQDIEPIAVNERVLHEEASSDSVDPLTVLDEDEGFDALFDDGDEDPAEFDFDAALASATGFPGAPAGSRNDADAAFDLGIELDDPGSPLDLGRGGAGAFNMEDLRVPPVSAPFSPARPSDLTVRPLSPEEEAPDLPVESRNRDETDDDMFSTMFRGR